MDKSVVIADSGVVIAAGNAYEIEDNDFLDAVGLEVELREVAPCIIAGKNAVSGG